MVTRFANRLRIGTSLALVCCILCLVTKSTSALDMPSYNNIHLASISSPGGESSAAPPARAAGTENTFDTLPRSYLVELDADGDLEQWRRWSTKLPDKAQGVGREASRGTASQVRKRVAQAVGSTLNGLRSQLRQHGFMAEEQSDEEEEQVQKSTHPAQGSSRSASAEPFGMVDDGAPPLYFRIRHEFDDASLLLGLSVTVTGYVGEASSDWTQLRDMKLLAAAKSVMRISPIVVIPPPSPWDGVIHIASSGASEASEINARRGPLDILGVPALHAEGINGSGVKIAIIDTGVDWTHPFLGGGFGTGRKVSFGYDLVGDDYDGFNDPVVDNDPLSSCGPHGTHIAGIIGALAPASAQSAFSNYSGIAPGAELGVFRVFGCRGGTADDILLKALQRAVKANADIITMSVGSPAGWSDTATARMVSAVAAKGRVVTVSAGNDGDAGLYFQSTPSVASDALAVASVNNDFLVAYNATLTTPSGEPKMITYYSAREFRLNDLQIWPFVTASAPTVLLDGCSTIPDSAPADLSNLIVIVKRGGGCSLEIKFRNLARSRVRYVLVANTGLAPFYPTGFGIEKAALIEGEDAELLVTLWNQQKSFTMSFPAMGPLSLANRLTAGIISPFSSYGPTFDLLSAPGIAAPGDRILSTWPISTGGWAVLSGTSMATPFTAGAAALLIQAAREGKCKAGMDNVSGKTMDIKGVRSVLDRLRSTARPASNSTKSSMLETTAKQGSGLLNVFDAVHALTSVSPASFMLGDSAIYPSRRSFVVFNGDDTARDFVVSHDAAGTALAFTTPSAYPNDGPAPLVEPHLSVTVTPSAFTLEPGSRINISVLFTLSDKDVDLDSFPVFSGYLRVASTPANNDGAQVERITASYMGIGKPTSANQVLDRGVGIKTTGAYSVPVLLIGGDERRPQQLPRAYTFLDNDYPVVSFRLLAGSRKLSIDLIEDLQADASGAARRALQQPGASCDESQAFDTHSASSASFPHLFFQAAPVADYAEAEDEPPLMIRAAAPAPQTTRAAIQATPDAQSLDIMRGREVGPIAVSTLLPRNTNSGGAWSSYALAWDGSIAGSPVPTGEYRLRISALKLGVGEPDAGQDLAEGGMRYDRWWSPIIRVQRSLDVPSTQPKAEVKTLPTQTSSV